MRTMHYLPMMVLLLAACGGDDQPETMAGMSVEDHSAHTTGAMPGATDTTGATVRQSVTLTGEQQRALGIVYAQARRGHLARTVRTVGRIEVAEPSVAEVTSKIDGFVEELHADETGRSVRQGEPLFTLYSPSLVAAQEELLAARRLLTQIAPDAGEPRANAEAMLDAARRRLRYWDISEDQIATLEERGEVTRALQLAAPATGVILEKRVVAGQRIMAGETLYRIADLSHVWIEGDVFERDLAAVALGAQAHIEVSAYPDLHVMGRVSFIAPTVDPTTRTVRVRVAASNPSRRLRPGMFATMRFEVLVGHDVLTVPLEAVVVTGERNVVFVRHDDMLMPHEVTLGMRAGDVVQILSGLSGGETVVASANFLVDAESRLAGTGGAMAGMDHGTPSEPAAAPMPMEHNHD